MRRRGADTAPSNWRRAQRVQDTPAYITTTVMPDEVAQDEQKVVHRPTMRIAAVVERATDMSG